MKKRKLKNLDFITKIGYIINNIPATPLNLRANAHFGRVFSFIKHIIHRASVLQQAKSGGFSFLEGCYGKI
jgi:hypothetical protein